MEDNERRCSTRFTVEMRGAQYEFQMVVYKR